MKELAPKYNHLEVEQGKYQEWVNKGYFTSGDITKKPFTIVIPPPNVTGMLHLGHAWDTTLQDMIIRYKRMQGYDALWLPGMDHAGIATQAKVEARLRESGISRYDLGREAFLEQVWSWKEEYASIIRKQWEKLGLSLDYSKERFTLDEGLSKAVNHVFVHLYNKGYIYQGERIINWDPVQKTALSNIEVIHEEIEGAMYYFNYDVVGSEETLVVATTRPETMFGDVCVFVHPSDPRFKHLKGHFVINPANGEQIPILEDDYIDIEFGTGAMKCTPAHDPNDFILGNRYQLSRPICMHPDGTMNALAHQYESMDRFECRKQLVEDLKAKGKVVKIEKHMHQVGHSERSHAIVEPCLSKQWFVKMDPLAARSLQNQLTEHKIDFAPERFEKIFSQWMEQIEDWCISRQLWWGHRIPAWYHNETGAVYVGVEPPQDIENYHQDEDVLDTWFSSALWPFSTLGWPKQTDLLQRYFPTDVLVTGYDIIFFWVSRMIFQSLEFTDQVPFKKVLIHGLIRDANGRKMSKSLGNGVDPMEVIEQYGADAMRFFLTTNSSPGMDLRYIEEKVESSWNFINKVWNASRFVLMHVDETTDLSLENKTLSMVDQWILTRLSQTIEHVNNNMEVYEFVHVGNALYKFIWDDFCSWYIELSKVNLANETTKPATVATLVHVLTAIVKMLHPFMPFVTEEIYSSLPGSDETITLASWPEVNTRYLDHAVIDSMDYLMDIIKGFRQFRVDQTIKQSLEIKYECLYKDESLNVMMPLFTPYIERLNNAHLVKLENNDDCSTIVIKGGHTLMVSMEGLINYEEEYAKLIKEKEHLDQEIKRAQGMLANPNFVSKAPEQKILAEKEKLQAFEVKLETVLVTLKQIESKLKP